MKPWCKEAHGNKQLETFSLAIWNMFKREELESVPPPTQTLVHHSAQKSAVEINSVMLRLCCHRNLVTILDFIH